MKIGIFLSILLITSTQAWAEKEVVMAADPWCPYTCEAGPNPGFMIEAATKILKDNGYKLTYKVMAWSRALEDTKAGKIDGAVGAGGGDAEDHILVEPAMTKAQNCFYTKPSSTWTYSSPTSLEKVVLGVPQDYTFGDDPLDTYIKKNTSNPKLIDAITGDDILSRNVKKVGTGRVDAFIEDTNVVQYYLKNNPGDKIRQAGCLDADIVTIGLSKKKSSSKELNKILGAGLKAMEASGELAKIKAKYGM